VLARKIYLPWLWRWFATSQVDVSVRVLARSRPSISTIIHQISALATLNLATFLPLCQFPDFRLNRTSFDPYFGINTDRSLEMMHRSFELSLGIEKVGQIVV
jgi:hypothetical protein